MITFYEKTIDGWRETDADQPMTFPAGERHIKPGEPRSDVACAAVLVTGTDANDYITAAMWIDLQQRRNLKVAALVPYPPGARQDRGKPLGALVYSELINAMQADQVIAFDPHSYAVRGFIKNVEILELDDVVGDLVRVGHGYTGVIAPDRGAFERAHDVALALRVPVFQGLKSRAFGTGELSGFSIEPLPKTGNLLVVDDICDGGGTFHGLADVADIPPSRLHLWVSHGVFSGNAYTLRAKYGRIITTNSYPSIDGSVPHEIVDITPYLLKKVLL